MGGNTGSTNSYWADVNVEESAFPPPNRLKAGNLGLLFLEQAEEIKNKCFAAWRDKSDNQWLTASWRESTEHIVKLISLFNSHLHLKAEDCVAIISGSRYEALLCDIAAVTCGAVAVPVDPYLSPDCIKQILEETKACVICLEDREQLDKLRLLTQEETVSRQGGPLAKIKGLICFEDLREHFPPLPKAEAYYFPEIQRLEESITSHVLHRFKEIANKLSRSAPACIQYSQDFNASPGATGRTLAPAVRQTHGNHIAMVDALLLSALLAEGDNVFIGLPFSCSFARICAYAAIALGGSVIFPTTYTAARSAGEPEANLLKQLRKDLRQSHPETVICDNDTLEQVCSFVLGQEKKMTKWALAEHSRSKALTEDGNPGVVALLRRELVKAVFSKVRTALFGTRIRRILSGAPPFLSLQAHDFYTAIGAPVFEGLWLTGATGALSSNTQKWNKQGTYGRPFEDMQVSINGSTGEVSISGPAVASPVASSASAQGKHLAISRTGQIDSEGYLRD
jgi:long-chain acyl-CoA synthetase